MSVQQLQPTKIIIKKDSTVLTSIQDKKMIKESEVQQFTTLYEEPYYNKTGNIDVNELATAITAKMVGGKMLVPKTKAIEVDIKKELFIDNIDKNAIQSEVINKKVETKINKLKELRKRWA